MTLINQKPNVKSSNSRTRVLSRSSKYQRKAVFLGDKPSTRPIYFALIPMSCRSIVFRYYIIYQRFFQNSRLFVYKQRQTWHSDGSFEAGAKKAKRTKLETSVVSAATKVQFCNWFVTQRIFYQLSWKRFLWKAGVHRNDSILTPKSTNRNCCARCECQYSVPYPWQWFSQILSLF